MARESTATATAGDTPAPEVAQSAPEGFEAVTVYNRYGEERVVESAVALVQAEFEGYSQEKPKKPVKR